MVLRGREAAERYAGRGDGILALFRENADISTGARIKREFAERDAYIWQQVEAGEIDVYAPKLRPQWENRFTFAYESDLDDDYYNWINMFYAEHYGIDAIWGVDREEWNEY